MASTALNAPLKQLNSLSQLTLVRQLGFMILLAASIALGTAVVMWSRTPEYSALFLDMSPQDANEVMASLEQQGVDYRVAAGSGVISVPAGEVHRIRLQLANQGLPRSTVQGYDILDQEQALGTSNFIEQARYNRALEQELVRTIKQIRGVREARVHLSIPRQSSFIRNSRTPSASVMLDIMGSQSLSDTQRAGILHLVSSSVAGMEPANVSIIDQQGNLLSNRSDSEIAASSEHMRFTRQIEQDYVERVVNILTPIVGEGRVRAQVSADVDYTIVETTEENFDPASRIIRSEQTQQEVSGSALEAAAEPGAVAPTPPVENAQADPAADPATGDGRSRINTTRNYEIDRSVSHIRSMPGSISRLSVAVLVDLNTAQGASAEAAAPADPAAEQARLDRLTQLVRDAIGFDATRGDSVSVINEPFSHLPDLAPFEAPPFWQQDWILPLTKQLGAGAVILLLIFAVLRPALRTVVAAHPALPGNASQALGHEGQDIGDDHVSLSGQTRQLARKPSRSVFDENLGMAQSLVEKEPVRAARMIKEWVAND